MPLANAHRHKQGGGGVLGGETKPFQHFTGGGFVNSSVPGRTDRIPTTVESNSYVIPADIISALGQGNSLAGAHVMDMILKTGPYRTSLPQPKGHGIRLPHPTAAYRKGDALAKGGKAVKTPVVIAGAEYIVSPSDIMRIGGGSITKGHELLDAFVKKMRKHNIEILKKLKPPVK